MSLNIIIIGASALGPKAACRCKRLMPDADVIVIDQSANISYGRCGIPFYVSGEISRAEDLQSTPYGAIRNEKFFWQTKGVKVLSRTRVIGIDRVAKTVRIEDLDALSVKTLSYDRLVLATGGTPAIPPIPGVDLGGVTAASTIEDATRIKSKIAEGKVRHAVIVGAGFIGLEMAVALADLWGIPVSLVEVAETILPGTLSPLLSEMAAVDLRKNGVDVYLGERVQRFEGEDGLVRRVVTDKRILEADMVIMGVGVKPQSTLAVEAGLSVTDKGLIVVDEHMRTSDPAIYSGGDVVAVRHLVTGRPGWFPMGSLANRQGRVIGTNLAGGNAIFSGAAGAWGIKLFSQSACGVGLTLEQALAEGFDAMSVHVEQVDRAHFYPGHDLMALEAVVERDSRRLLGVQGMGAAGDALVGRINAITPCVANAGTVADLSNLEVVYAPPFAAAMDIVNVLGNVAENVLEGRSRTLDADEFARLWQNRSHNSVCFLDTRDQASARPFVEAHPDRWINIPQDMLRERLHDLPDTVPLVLICNTGLRAYEAQRLLDACGRRDTRSVAGGLAAVSRSGQNVLKV